MNFDEIVQQKCGDIEDPFDWRGCNFREALKYTERTGRCPYRAPERLTFDDLLNAFRPDARDKDIEYAVEKASEVGWNFVRTSELHYMPNSAICADFGMMSMMPFEYDEEREKWTCEFEGQYKEIPLKEFFKDKFLVCIDNRPRFYYTDSYLPLATRLCGLDRAKIRSEKILWLDKIVNMVHGSGAMAPFLVEGGVRTLDELKEWK